MISPACIPAPFQLTVKYSLEMAIASANPPPTHTHAHTKGGDQSARRGYDTDLEIKRDDGEQFQKILRNNCWKDM